MNDIFQQLLRITTVVFPLVVFILTCWYYTALCIRHQAGTRLITIERGLNTALNKALSGSTREYIILQFKPALAKARHRFLTTPGYWKTIHKDFLAAGMSLENMGNTIKAVRLYIEGTGYHPLFMSFYEALGDIFKKIGLHQRAARCRIIYDDIKQSKSPCVEDFEICLGNSKSSMQTF